MTDSQAVLRRGGPLLSVIIPVYEQWDLVPNLLKCLEAQEFPSVDYEVILIDNGSKSCEGTAMTESYTILRCEQPGSYAARNMGVAAAKGQWLVFTDADCLPHADWLSRLAARFDSGSDRLYAGDIVVKSTSPRPNAHEIYDMLKGIPQRWYVSRGYAATANLAVPMALFQTLGGFDGRRFSGGDSDFCRRAVAHGAKLIFVAEAVVDHPARSTWEELSRKARRLKGGQLLNQRSRRRLVISYIRTFLPPVIAFYRLLGRGHWPFRYRLIAVAVQTRLWLLEMGEALRITFGGRPERR